LSGWDERFDILVCPQCHGPLEKRPAELQLACPKCRLIYKIEHNIPVMLIEEAERY